MKTLQHLLDSNRNWAHSVNASKPGFFDRLSAQQSPKMMWIGCSDSRVPATEICGLEPGEMFVHRNVANLVVHTDLNCLSTLQFAVEVLRVQHVIVCGHYGCGGVRAALGSDRLGLIDNWLRNVKDVLALHRNELFDLPEEGSARANKLVELNVLAQVRNLASTTIVQDAWLRRQDLTIHGWVYGVSDGLLKDLGASVSSLNDVPASYRMT